MSRDIYRAGPLTVTRFAGSTGTALQLTPTTAGGYIVITDPMVAIELAAALELWGRTEATRRREGGGEYAQPRQGAPGGPPTDLVDYVAALERRQAATDRRVMDQAQALARLEQDIRALDRVGTEGRGDLTNYIRGLQNGQDDARHARRRLEALVVELTAKYAGILETVQDHGRQLQLAAESMALLEARVGYCFNAQADGRSAAEVWNGWPESAPDASPGPGEAPG